MALITLMLIVAMVTCCCCTIRTQCYPGCKCRRTRSICDRTNLTFIPPFPEKTHNITFSRNQLHTVSNETFKNVSKLSVQYLDLYQNNITWIARDAFVTFKWIKTLSLSGNPTINASALAASFGSLKPCDTFTLELDTLNLTVIPDDFFVGLNGWAVRKISLRHNGITTLNGVAFKGLKNLQKLDLSFNEIQRAADTDFASLVYLKLHDNMISPTLPVWFCNKSHAPLFPNIRTLELNNNGIYYIDRDSFTCLKNLKTLGLSNNVLRTLPNNTFADLGRLRELYLDHLIIKKIEPLAFNISNLLKLHINDIGIDTRAKRVKIPYEELFKFTRKLEFLDMSNNRLKDLAPKTLLNMFRPLSALRTLILQKVGMNRIPTKILQSTRNLSMLNLNGNIIGAWTKYAFTNTSSIKTLLLQGNRISILTEDMLPPALMSSLHKINLADNPFACDCKNLWFQNWVSSKHRVNKLALLTYPGRYHCRSPPALENLRLDKYKPTTESCTESFVLLAVTISIGVVFIVTVIASTFAYRGRWYIRYWIVKYVRRKQVNGTEEEPLLGNRERPYDAYVVYTDADHHFACHELRALVEEEMHMTLFLSDRDGGIGVSKVDDIVDNMYNSRRVLVVLTNAFLMDPWCQFQLDVARDREVEMREDLIFLIRCSDIDSRSLSKSWCVLMTRTPTGIWSTDDLKKKLFVAQVREVLERSS